MSKTARLYILWALLASLALGTIVVAMVPAWRESASSFLYPDDRVLLATVRGDLFGEGRLFRILKYKVRRGLLIEVRRVDPEPDGSDLVDRVMIPDRHDGFFEVRGEATRLALIDVDQDGRLEIVAPSFDDRLIAHLNVLRLAPESLKLEFVRGSSIEGAREEAP